MNNAACPRIGSVVRSLAAPLLCSALAAGAASMALAQQNRVDEITAELSSLETTETADVQHVQSVMAELALLPSEDNSARATLDILRRARTLRGDTTPIRDEEIESLVADLAEVAAPEVSLFSDNYRDAQVTGDEANERPFDDDAPVVPVETEDEASVAEEEAPATDSEAPADPAATEDAAAPGDAPVPPAPGDAPMEPTPPPARTPEQQQSIQDSNTTLNEAMRELAEQAGASTATMMDSSPNISAPGDVATGPLPKPKSYTGDPMSRPVNLDFREMELSNVVALLAHMAGINVVAGTDVSGTVTANLQGVPLRQAMETALRLNGLGLLEEEGIYYIVPYADAVQEQRRTELITLENAKAKELQTVLSDLLKGSPDERIITVTSNEAANVVLVSGPEKRIADLIRIAKSLDIAETVLPTVTEAIKVNYGTPEDMVEMVEKMLTKGIGQASADTRSRSLIVTDQPVVVEQVRQLLTSLDLPVKEVMIDSMVVDVTLEDDAETGVDWLINSVRRQSRRDVALGNDTAIGNLQELGLSTGLPSTVDGGLLNFAVLSSRLDWRGVVQAEIRALNGKFVSNPVVYTVENKPAKIEIVRDIPYVEVKETSQGGSQTNTEFKQIGTILEVTPRVTHDNFIIAEIMAKESDTNGEFNGIPIEDRRSVETTMHMRDGETIFMGGLRKRSDSTTVRKVPILGDVPVLNVLFRNNSQLERTTELMVFLTCKVMDPANKNLTPKQQFVHNDGVTQDLSVNALEDIKRTTIDPKGMQDPMYKFRRGR